MAPPAPVRSRTDRSAQGRLRSRRSSADRTPRLPCRRDRPRECRLLMRSCGPLGTGRRVAVLIVTPWGQDPAGAWRDAIRHGIGHDVRWCFCVNGSGHSAVRRRRARTRDDSRSLISPPPWTTRSRSPLSGDCCAAMRLGQSDGQPMLDRAVEICERHRIARARVSERRRPAGDRRNSRMRSVRRRGAGDARLASGSRIADRHLPRPVPAVCGGARAGAEVASRLPGLVHDRIAASRGGSRAAAPRVVGIAPGDRASRPSRLPGGSAARRAVQRPIVLARRRAARRLVAAGRRTGATRRCWR